MGKLYLCSFLFCFLGGILRKNCTSMEKEEKKEMISLLMTSYPKGPDVYTGTSSVGSPKMFYVRERCRNFEKKKRKIPRRLQLCSEYEHEILHKWEEARLSLWYHTVVWCGCLALVLLLFLGESLQGKYTTHVLDALLYFCVLFIAWKLKTLKSKVLDTVLGR